MKVFKISKKDLAEPEKLLRKVGATVDSYAFPEYVYVSKEDYATLKRNLTNSRKGCYEDLSKEFLTQAVNWQMLNFGPNQSLEAAIKPGFVLVDTSGINKRMSEINDSTRKAIDAEKRKVADECVSELGLFAKMFNINILKMRIK